MFVGNKHPDGFNDDDVAKDTQSNSPLDLSKAIKILAFRPGELDMLIFDMYQNQA